MIETIRSLTMRINAIFRTDGFGLSRSVLPTRRISCALVLIASFALGACSTNVSRFQMPGTDLQAIQTMYLEPSDDEREGEELLPLIQTGLTERGYQVIVGELPEQFSSGEFIFDYEPDWDWDVSYYLLDLRVAIYEPSDNTLIAQAQSTQTSLARKPIDIVAGRALASLFNESPDDTEDSE